MCNLPCDPSTECFNLPITDKIPDYARRINHPVLGTIPVFSTNCAFRQENLWDAHVNYPVSKALIESLSEIAGINKVLPIKPYIFQISVAQHFDEAEVKREINLKFVSFVKNIFATHLQEIDVPVMDVEFPNGNILSNEVNDYIKNLLLDEFPDLKKILK